MKKKIFIISLLILAAGISIGGVFAYKRQQDFYNSPGQVKKRQEEEYAAQREALADSRKELETNAEESIKDALALYDGDYASYQVKVDSAFSEASSGNAWKDSATVNAEAKSDWGEMSALGRYQLMDEIAERARDGLQTEGSRIFPDGFDDSYRDLTDDITLVTCYEGKLSYEMFVDVTLTDSGDVYHLTITDAEDLYDDTHYDINGAEVDPDTLQPTPTVSAGSGNSPSHTHTYGSTGGSSGSSDDDDEYHVNDYDDPEDFYEDNADDFEDEEDAEDYYDEYHD